MEIVDNAYGKRTQPTFITETLEEAYAIIAQHREQDSSAEE